VFGSKCVRNTDGQLWIQVNDGFVQLSETIRSKYVAFAYECCIFSLID
jgi:ligand-binding sensor domain-containing protein